MNVNAASKQQGFIHMQALNGQKRVIEKVNLKCSMGKNVRITTNRGREVGVESL